MSSIYSLSCPVQLAILSGGRFVVQQRLPIPILPYSPAYLGNTSRYIAM